MNKLIIILMGLCLISSCSNSSYDENIVIIQDNEEVGSKANLEYSTDLSLDNISYEKTPLQVFEVSMKDKNKIKIIGEKGTEISFNRKCFKNDIDSIKIELREYYDLPSMILSKLGTTAGDKLIETDGMIYVDVKNPRGESCELLEHYEVSFPAKKRKKRIKIFEGEFIDGNMDWSLSKSEILKNNNNSESIPWGDESEILDTYFNEFMYESSLSTLGWINCDRFIESEESIVYLIDVDSSMVGVFYVLIFEEFNENN